MKYGKISREEYKSLLILWYYELRIQNCLQTILVEEEPDEA
jgi:hypothetical protein